MIRTVVTPANNNLLISIPNDYVGKQIEVLLYTSEEVNEKTITPKNSIAALKGKLNLSPEQYKDFQQHIKEIRNEWERDI